MNSTDNFILDHSPEAICYGEVCFNEKGEVIDFIYDYINPQYAAMTGIKAGRARGQNMKRLFRTNDCLKTFKTLQRFVDTGEDTCELYLDTFRKHFKVHYNRMGEKKVCAWINDVTSDKLMIQTMDEILNGNT